MGLGGGPTRLSHTAGGQCTVVPSSGQAQACSLMEHAELTVCIGTDKNSSFSYS